MQNCLHSFPASSFYPWQTACLQTSSRWQTALCMLATCHLEWDMSQRVKRNQSSRQKGNSLCTTLARVQALLEVVTSPEASAIAADANNGSPLKIALFSLGNMCAHSVCAEALLKLRARELLARLLRSPDSIVQRYTQRIQVCRFEACPRSCLTSLVNWSDSTAFAADGVCWSVHLVNILLSYPKMQ